MPEFRARARHDLVWLDPDAAATARPLPICTESESGSRSQLADWIAADRPLVVARQPVDLPPGRLLLGLSLPSAGGKQRLAFEVAVARIARSAPPPPLAAISVHMPKKWHATLDALLASPAISAANPRAYGSAAMQALTGLACVGDDSDLDLLLAPTSREAALAAMNSLADIDSRGNAPRLDGELVDRHGRASSWRELMRDTRQILVKQLDAVGMSTHEDFLAGFGNCRT